MTLIQAIQAVFQRKRRAVQVQELYAELPDELEHSIRARIYENLGKMFHRIDRGLYVAVQDEAACIVIQGDAWDEIKRIPSRFVDAMITDPPYPWLDAILRIHSSTRPRMRWDFEKKEIDRDLGLELWRVLKDGAHAFFFVPAETATTRPHIEHFIRLLESCGFVFNKRWVWHKQVLGMGYSGRGCHEAILFMSKGCRRMPCDLSVPDVLSFKPIDSGIRKHPCEKPQALLEQIIRFATRAGEMVLDCFGGSLSTARAALAIGRNSIVIEKDQGILERVLV